MKKLILFSFICLSAVFISCSRPADELQTEDVPVGEHIFSRDEILNLLATNGILASFTITDEKYIAPTAQWVKGEYSSKLTKFLFDYNLNHWTKESSDCDDISRAAATYGSMLFHNSRNRPKGVGLLFGEMHYFKNGREGHAINIILVKDGANYRIMYYEPQSKFEITRDSNESVIWFRF